MITVYSGGALGASYPGNQAHGPAPKPVVRDTLASLERVVPGISDDFTGRAWLDHWAADPWVHGSYAAFLPGQTIRYSGVIARQEGGLYSQASTPRSPTRGFLEGAVGSAERCTREVLVALK